MREKIYSAIAAALSELGAPDANFVVERPGDLAHGDYATNAALIAAKVLEKNPREVAELLQEKLLSQRSSDLPQPSSDGSRARPFAQEVSPSAIEQIEIAGPGFINFFLSKDAIAGEIEKVAKGEFEEIRSDLKGQSVMVEYTDPNPFKEFHIGHLMSNTIGESIARLLEASGSKVIRANYQGDVGPHVAKAIWGVMQENKELNGKGMVNLTAAFLGKAYARGAKAYEEDSEIRKEIDEINKKIYLDLAGNSVLFSQYKIGRNISLEHFEEIYKILGTEFDKNFYFFESETWQKGLAAVELHIQDGVFEKSDGAVIFKGEKVGLHTRVFINSAGLPTYEAKDLGLLELKQERAKREGIKLDFSVTVTASEQTEYFKVVLAAAGRIPELRVMAAKTLHVSHGMMRFAEGKMSSRKGNVITGESLLMDLKDAAKEKMQGRELPEKDANKIAEQIAVGAIKYAVLKQGSGKDIIFDPEKSLSLQGDSGPYLQYARVRALSIMKAAKEAGIVASGEKLDVVAFPDQPAAETGDFSTQTQTRATLERTLIHFTEVVERAAAELEPHYVTTYLTELASAFNSWYMAERVVGGPNPAYALLLTESFEQTMQKGLHLLGIPSPEEM